MFTKDNLPVQSPVAQDDNRDDSGHMSRLAPLVVHSTTAKALMAAWQGSQLVVVESPPGGGKTYSAVTIASHLSMRIRLRVVVACATKSQCIGVAWRLTEQLPSKYISVNLHKVPAADIPPRTSNNRLTWGVEVRTIASLAASSVSKPQDSILVVDEAGQATVAELTAAANGFSQVIALGDPGQIGPVVTHDTSYWSGDRVRPYDSALVYLARHKEAVRLHIGETRRFGDETVRIVSPFYHFNFVSNAKPRWAEMDGERLPEIARLRLPDDDWAAMQAVARRVALLLGSKIVVDGDEREARQSDIGVVVSRNVQDTMLSAMLSNLGCEKVAIGTADRMQGREWPIVVAVDPCFNAQAGNDHAISDGRACVMMSRHSCHLTWAYSDNWTHVLTNQSAPGYRARELIMSTANV